MNTGYAFTATCHCGALLEHLADGVPTPTSSRAMTRCTECCAEYVLEVRLIQTRHTRASGQGPTARQLEHRKKPTKKESYL